MEDRFLLTAKQMAEVLNVKQQFMYDAVRLWGLECVRQGPRGGKIMFKEKETLDWHTTYTNKVLRKAGVSKSLIEKKPEDFMTDDNRKSFWDWLTRRETSNKPTKEEEREFRASLVSLARDLSKNQVSIANDVRNLMSSHLKLHNRLLTIEKGQGVNNDPNSYSNN